MYEYIQTSRGNWVRYDNVSAVMRQGVMLRLTMLTGSKSTAVFESEEQAEAVQKYWEKVNEQESKGYISPRDL